MAQNTAIDLNNLPEPSQFKGPKGIPIEAIIDLTSKNLSRSQIAKLLGCSPSNITRRMQDIEITKKFVNNRAMIFAFHQQRIINSITPTNLKKANLRDKIISAGVLYDKERLETGQSTQNIAYADALKARDQAKMSLDDLQRIYKERQSEIEPQNNLMISTRSGEE